MPKVPPQVMRDVLGGERFSAIAEDLAHDTGLSVPEVRARAASCLEEMAANHGGPTVAGWRKAGKWMSRAYDLDVDAGQLDELRRIDSHTSLVFLPNHRSYLDPVVLSSVLNQHGFGQNHVLGGDNLAFWPMASLAKQNGIVFIRREFRGDSVYRAVLREYLRYLVRTHSNLEWYIEGGRSRTGKIRPPRYGILSYVVDAYENSDVEDVLVVPVSITYDQQHEIEAISKEERGGSKKAEGIGWLVNYAKSQSRRMGKVHVRFGDTISFRDLVAEAEASGDQRNAVPKIAFEVCRRINEVTPIAPTSLATFALLDNDDHSLNLSEGRAVLAPLLDYVGARRLPIIAGVDLRDHGLMRDALRTLIREGVVERYDKGIEPVFGINPKRSHEAGFYRNTLLHHFINRAIVEVAVVQAAEESPEDLVTAVWRNVLALRDLLKFEFFFARTKEFGSEIAAEVELVEPEWRQKQYSANELLGLLEGQDLHVAHRVVGPLVEAYAVVADRLADRQPGWPIEDKAFIEECIGVAHQYWLQGRLHSPESISRDLFTGALNLAKNRNLVESGGEELRAKRLEFATELADAVRRVRVIRDMAQRRLRALNPTHLTGI